MCMRSPRGASLSWAGWTFLMCAASWGIPMPTCWRMLSPMRCWEAFAAGILGNWSPAPTPAFKDADSLKLLAAVADKVRAEGYVILDVDSVIAAQAPKLSPYREAMRENLAAAMGIAVENVGVKATTTEHLGFEGREEGISATAVCLLCRRPDEQRD